MSSHGISSSLNIATSRLSSPAPKPPMSLRGEENVHLAGVNDVDRREQVADLDFAQASSSVSRAHRPPVVSPSSINPAGTVQ